MTIKILVDTPGDTILVEKTRQCFYGEQYIKLEKYYTDSSGKKRYLKDLDFELLRNYFLNKSSHE